MNEPLSRLKAAFHTQRRAIEAALQREIAALPPAVRPVARHILEAGGKRLRPMLVLLTAHALGASGEGLYPPAVALEMLHSATLIHDDILDGAALRRGRPAAHTIFGLVPAILAGDALLAHANAIMARSGLPELTRCAADAIMATAAGEIEEINALQTPQMSQDDYLRIITGKTAYLIQAACEAGAILAGAAPHLQQAARAYGLGLGIAFQLVDDALDYAAQTSTLGKPQGGDLREGKRTLPLLLYLETLPHDERHMVATRIHHRQLTDAEHQAILDQVHQGGFALKTIAAAKRYVDDALTALQGLPPSPEREVLEALGSYVLTREK